MSGSRTYTQGELTIVLNEESDSLVLKFHGKSKERDPGVFLTPVLDEILGTANSSGRAVVLDFCELGYMNSSTFTPVIRFLERVRNGSDTVKVIYNDELKWQILSFQALEIFETDDGRVTVVSASDL